MVKPQLMASFVTVCQTGVILNPMVMMDGVITKAKPFLEQLMVSHKHQAHCLVSRSHPNPSDENSTSLHENHGSAHMTNTDSKWKRPFVTSKI